MEGVIDHLYHEDVLGLHPDIASVIPDMNESIICNGGRFLVFNSQGNSQKLTP